MSTKFKAGEKVLFNGEEVVIKVAKKNFSTKKITYRLEHPNDKNKQGAEVGEDALKKTKEVQPTQDRAKLKAARAEYKELFGEKVSPFKHNDLTWIVTTIVEKKEAAAKEGKTPYEILEALSLGELTALIAEKELDIDPADYSDVSELLTAVCEVLEIELPE